MGRKSTARWWQQYPTCRWFLTVILPLASSLLVSAFTPLSPSICHQCHRQIRSIVAPTPNNINVDIVRKKKVVHHRNISIIKSSPSGIDEWPQVAQASVFFGTYIALGLSTYTTTQILESLSKSIGLERWRLNAIDTTLPVLLGFFYLLAGVGHFANAEGFRDIYPRMGTWGIWYLPGSAEFHVAWTGVVELIGGLGLLFGGANDAIGSEDDDSLFINFIKPVSASLLFVLTILVTPANIYMFTHGAVMGDMAQLDMSFHAVRFVVQVVLLSLLYTLARDSFFFAWGDKLD